jgi:hypothetical protein
MEPAKVNVMNGLSMKWVNGYAALYADPNPNGKRVRYLVEKSLVIARDEVVYYQGHPFVQVEYADAKTWSGWVYAGMLEDYVENLPHDVVVLDDQTVEKHDAEQFVIYNGGRQVNLCGEICAAYVMNLSLTVMLELWKQEKPTIWKRIFKRFGWTAGGTGVPDLISMFAAGQREAYPLAEATRDPYLERSRYTPAWLKRLTEKGKVVASVTIDKAGRLVKSGDLHWVVVTEVVPERCGYGAVVIYNPYPNRHEAYSWREFLEAAKVPSGAFVPEVTL